MFAPISSQQGFPNQQVPQFGGVSGVPMPINIASSDSTLYVGNLSTSTDENRLHSFFTPYGQVMTTRIMRDIYTLESRRFGFVSFGNVEEAQKAKDALNYQKLDNFEIRICFKKVTS